MALTYCRVLLHRCEGTRGGRLGHPVRRARESEGRVALSSWASLLIKDDRLLFQWRNEAPPTIMLLFLNSDLAVLSPEESARIQPAIYGVRLHAVPPRPGACQGIVHLDLHPDNVLLGPDGPVVIHWRNAVAGPPALDLAVTALIIALVASAPEHPLGRRAAELLSAFAHLANGHLRSGLPGAVELRRADPNLSADEKARLEAAATLVQPATTA
jgi:hypothetical protein